MTSCLITLQELFQRGFEMIPLTVVIIVIASTFTEWSACLKGLLCLTLSSLYCHYISLPAHFCLWGYLFFLSIFPFCFFYLSPSVSSDSFSSVASSPLLSRRSRSFLSCGELSSPAFSEKMEIWIHSINPSSHFLVSPSSPFLSFSSLLDFSPEYPCGYRHIKDSLTV